MRRRASEFGWFVVLLLAACHAADRSADAAVAASCELEDLILQDARGESLIDCGVLAGPSTRERAAEARACAEAALVQGQAFRVIWEVPAGRRALVGVVGEIMYERHYYQHDGEGADFYACDALTFGVDCPEDDPLCFDCVARANLACSCRVDEDTDQPEITCG